ncbi:hypothetical protein D3C78_1491170 [compost metagenome]
MSAKDCDYSFKPTQLFLDKDGVVYHYFTSAMMDDESEDRPLFEWATAVQSEAAQEGADINLAIVLDLPALTHELLSITYGEEKAGGGYDVPVQSKEQLEHFRRQLVESLALFDKIDYS